MATRKFQTRDGICHAVEVRPDSGYWTLYVDGRPLVERESFAVADRVADGLVKPGAYWPSEADEVSSSILKWITEVRASGTVLP